MADGNKEKNQIVILAVLLIGILGIIGYVFRNEFLPKPTGTQPTYAAPVKLQASAARIKQILQRDDYRQLENFGKVPVEVNQTEAGTPFRAQK